MIQSALIGIDAYHLCPVTIDTEIPSETGATTRDLRNLIDCQ